MSNLENTYINYFGEEWYQELKNILFSDYFKDLKKFLKEEKRTKDFLPKDISLSFRAFRETPFNSLKVVILGQDVYPDGSFDGFAFSNGKREKGISPSLRNILKEVKREYPDNENQSKDLKRWANQGVFLINVGLSVIRGNPGIHINKWKQFIKYVMEKINTDKEGIVFLLWGNFASKYGDLVDEDKHYVIRCGHPSPLNTKKPFLGCGCFKETNEYLIKENKEPIKW